jgi:cytochrome c
LFCFEIYLKKKNATKYTSMKRYFVILAAITFLAACGGNGSENSSSNKDSVAVEKPATNDISSNPDYQNGLALISKSDCLTCHKISEKLIGPAYQDVANKYAGSDTALAYLSEKIIKGGTGVWGTVAMTPHPALTEADAQQMVKYILLLKTN